MIKFKLTENVWVIPTSAHGCRFSNGVCFDPSEEEIGQIKTDWEVLKVNRSFAFQPDPLPGIKASKSKQTLTVRSIDALEKAQADNPNAIILVPFMLASALTEAGLAPRFPRVLAANATLETCRERPENKVWDIHNFSAL